METSISYLSSESMLTPETLTLSIIEKWLKCIYESGLTSALHIAFLLSQFGMETENTLGRESQHLLHMPWRSDGQLKTQLRDTD